MMKLALLGLFCLEAALALTPSRALVEDWEAWKQQHSKSYSSNSQDKTKMKVWMENKAAIEEHNRQFKEGVHTYHLAMNEFSDLSGDEFVSKMNGFQLRREEREENGNNFLVSASSGSLPDRVDWREKGAVTGVRLQRCKDCWAFSASGALEAAHQIKTGQLLSLSVQQLVDCSKENNGCNGGDTNKTFDYIKTNGGLDTEESYPYEGRDGKCRYSASSIGAKNVGYKKIKFGDENALKSAVATVGPVSVAIDARRLQHFPGGFYSDKACSSEDLTHAVLVVGYGTEDGKDYWLIKNSWGTGWGEKGYMKMARNENNMCGVASYANFPLV